MSRIVTVGAAQLGPIARTDSRAQAIARLIALMLRAKSHGCDLVVFPECALTAFFPHWYFERQTGIDAYFEREMPNAATQPLFDCARELSIGFYLGFAELTIDDGVTRRFNTSILVEKDSRIVGKYRKINLPGHREYEPWRPFQNGCWVVGVAKAGTEDGVRQIGNSVIVAPSGEIAATCSTEGDELAIARCDLDLTLSYKNTTFDFARHRQPQAYGLIVERTGAIPPPL